MRREDVKRAQGVALALFMLAVLLLAGCGGGEPSEEAADGQTTPSPRATTAPTPTTEPVIDLSQDQPLDIETGVFATGYVRAAQDADLVFQVNGEVDEVLVEEGDYVQEDELLALLDTRRFDQDVRNAEAALIRARADQLSLVEDPQPEQVQAAQAAVNQAAGRLNQAQGSVTPQDIAAAQATLEEARTALADLQDGPAEPLEIEQAQARYREALNSMQRTRDQLSHAKTQAEINLQQAAERVRSAQINYSSAYWDWQYVRDHGKAPPRTELDEQRGPSLADQGEQSYRNQLNQAEINLQQAEDSLRAAEKNLEEARLAEIEGIQAAEARVEQASITVEQLQEPADPDQLAAAQARVANAEANLARLQGQQRAGELQAAQASLESAQAQLDQLYSDPTESQSIRAEAGIASAEANLEQARLNREYAEIRAPFAGEVATVNIDPGDPAITAGAGGQAAIRLVDLSDLYVEVDVTDADIAQVNRGQPARVVADALPDQAFIGEVTFVSPAAETSQQGIITYLVRILLDEEDVPLRAGMSVSVTILPEDAEVDIGEDEDAEADSSDGDGADADTQSDEDEE
jgi:HlyD family secretion protein